MVRYISIFAGLCFLAGCGENFHTFQCKRSDFDKIETSVKTNRGIRQSMGASSTSYYLAKNLNAALERSCPQPVRQTCSPGQESVVQDKNKILGPVNSFGVQASVELVQKYRKHMGEAMALDADAVYTTTVDEKTFHATLQCYQTETD